MQTYWMQSDVIRGPLQNLKSWEELRSSSMLAEIEKWPTRKIRLTATSRLNPPEAQHSDIGPWRRGAKYHRLVSFFRFGRLLMFSFQFRVSRLLLLVYIYLFILFKSLVISF